MGKQGDDSLVRPLRQGMVEIGVFAGVFCLLTAALVWQDLAAQQQGWAGVPAWIDSAGTTLEKHVGWFFGVLISLLLSLYAFVGGGQIFGVPHVQRSRRILGFVAELFAAATVPPVVVLLWFAVLHADERALVLVLVPAEAAVLFLGAQLGGFIVFDRDERHRAALANAATAEIALVRLRNRSRYSGWLVLAVHAVGVGSVSWLAASSVFHSKPILLLWPLLIALVPLAAVVTITLFAAAWFSRTATDRVGRVLPWFVPYGVVLFLLVAAVSQPFSRAAAAVDAALAVQLIALVVSTHARSSRRWWRNWSVGGAARRMAAREVVRRYARATREARETRPDEGVRRTLRTSLRRWVQRDVQR
jgi:hypothetical protein